MKKSIVAVWAFVLAWAFIIVLLAFFIQARCLYGNIRPMYGENPIIKARQEVIEAFESKPPVEDSDDGSDGKMRPGDPELANPREPYSLLKGWLKPLDHPQYPTAEKCHDVDFQVRLERTGNFRQMTNNYKRGDPDSCSGQTQDLTLAFYKTEPVPQTGCIQPYVE